MTLCYIVFSLSIGISAVHMSDRRYSVLLGVTEWNPRTPFTSCPFMRCFIWSSCALPWRKLSSNRIYTLSRSHWAQHALSSLLFSLTLMALTNSVRFLCMYADLDLAPHLHSMGSLFRWPGECSPMAMCKFDCACWLSRELQQQDYTGRNCMGTSYNNIRSCSEAPLHHYWAGIIVTPHTYSPNIIEIFTWMHLQLIRCWK